MAGMRAMPRRLLPDTMEVREQTADGGFGEAKTIAHVRFERKREACAEAHRSESLCGRVYVDAVTSVGAYEVPAGSRVESLGSALEAVRKAKRRLFEKLADREIEREEFLERKKGYDAEIERMEREVSDAELAERIAREADGEARERADVARSFLDVGEMSEEIWERFVAGARMFPDGRIEVEWNFGDEME